MNSSVRTKEISIPINALIQYYEPVLRALGEIKPGEELVKLETGHNPDIPWWDGVDQVPLRFTIQNVKEVERIEVDGKAKKKL